MKSWGVSARKVACHALALGCLVFMQLAGARSARADSPRKVEGYELLGSLGYGIGLWGSTGGVIVGADFGYTFPVGLRLGTDAGFALSHSKYTKWNGEVVASADPSITWGGSIGYDLLLSSVRLRGA